MTTVYILEPGQLVPLREAIDYARDTVKRLEEELTEARNKLSTLENELDNTLGKMERLGQVRRLS